MFDFPTQISRRFVTLTIGATIVLIFCQTYIEVSHLFDSPYGYDDHLINIIFSVGLLCLMIFSFVVVRTAIQKGDANQRARRQAEDTLKLYLRALEASTTGVTLLDARKVNNPILYANPAFEQMTGFPVYEVLGKEWNLFWKDEQTHPAAIQLRHAVELRRSCTVELQSIRKDGSQLWIEVKLAPVLDDSGVTTHFITILNDITTRRQTEESLRNSQQFVERINNIIPDAVYVLDISKQQTIYKNAVFENLWNSLSGAPQNGDWNAILSITHPDDAVRLTARLPNLKQAADHNVVESEYRLRHNDGTWHWYHNRETIFARDSQGTPTQIIGTTVDITPRKQVEENLHKSRQFVERINQLIPDNIYILDFMNQRIIYQNKALALALGYSEANTDLDEWGFHLSNVHPDDLEKVVDNLNLFVDMAEDSVVESERRIKDKNGQWRWFMVREIIFARAEDRIPTQILGVATDITERKETEATLRAREQEYRELYASTQRHAQELSLLDKIRTVLLGEIDYSTLIKVIVDEISGIFGYQMVSIYLFHDRVLQLQYQVGYQQAIDEIPLDKGVIGKVVRTGMPVLLEDVESDADFLAATDGIVSEICVPLYDQNKVVGVLNVESTNSKRLNHTDLRLLTALSEQLSIAIGRARLYAKLQMSEERYRVISDLISDYAYSFNVANDGTLIHDWITDSYSRLTGYGLDEAINETSSQLLYPPEEQIRVTRDIETTLRGKETTGEYRIITKSGDERWIRIFRRPVWDEQKNRVVKLYGVAQDITDSIIAEQLLQNYVREVEDLYNEAPCAYHSLDPDGVFSRVNDTELVWLGYTREDLIDTMNFVDLLSEQDHPRWKEAFSRLPDTGYVIDLEFQVRCKNGTYFTVLLNATAVYDDSGTFVNCHVTMFDISDRKRIELAEQEHRALTEGVSAIAARLGQTLDLDEVLDLLLASVRRVVPHTTVSLMLIDNQQGRIVRHFGFDVTDQTFPLQNSGAMHHIMSTNSSMIFDDAPTIDIIDKLMPESSVSHRSYLGVPISIDDSVVAILHVTHTERKMFTARHAEHLKTLAAQASVAIQNARLYRQAQEFAMLEERQRLARDLHDAVSQTLFSASVVAETLPRMWDRQKPDDVKKGLAELKLLTRGALAEMRNLLAELRPNALTETNLITLLKQLTDATAGHVQIPILLDTSSYNLTLPPDVRIVFYRIAQEALSNIIKHARAQQVKITISAENEIVHMDISDDGRGFDQALLPEGHYGLQIMHERALGIDAHLTVTSQIGVGTNIHLEWTAAVKVLTP
ncbi:MAG: PAS domain S-box protein [Anaerolineae bacterium]